MRKSKKIAIWISGILSIGVLSILGVFGYIAYQMKDFDDMCGNTIEQSLKSPNNRMKVVVFERDCGATTGFSRQVSLLNANDKLQNTSGNVIVFRGLPRLHILWKSNKNLEITHNSNDVGNDSIEVRGVQIDVIKK
jgi:hypothetical protein